MTITETEIAEMIGDSLYLTDEDAELIENMSTFYEDGLITSNDGIVIKMLDGTEFQVTIKQSR